MICKDNQEYNISLNMSDLLFRYNGHENILIDYIKEVNCERIYIGSYFCSHYFMKTISMFNRSMLEALRENRLKATLVIPIIYEEEKELFDGSILLILSAALDVIDEVVVNDIAMLKEIYNLKKKNNFDFSITAGRLMVKNFRDLRYKNYSEGRTTLFFPAGCAGKIQSVEIDLVSSELDFSEIPEDINIHVHYPYTYVSCGKICEYAAAKDKNNLYFQTNKRCGSACSNGYMTTELYETKLFHVGKAVYFENPELTDQNRIPDRYIYWPLKELFNSEEQEVKENENSCTF